jgi:DNA polymerase III subunit gamma/tau
LAYTALARTWRPKKFDELVGQEHVRRALVNALESGRVHHAFLFTGTRGVGKTTIARIFAKCLNCETGVTANPCGVCGACREIDAGRFVDLIEVDAASRTKVDDTRELLDNVQYAPARGRYKVYLIDEVHMLSTHSFNALLKTFEEPPPHVKFLLATTDPQKLPVTVLSRCLQFNLKRLPVAQITERMREILEKEKIESEPAGLRLIAQAADGSMRDGLSLLDQLIAFGGGKAGEAEARAMLGTIARDHVVRLAELLGEMNVPELLRCAQSLEEFAPDYAQVLDELASLFVRIALKQAVSDFEGDELYAPEVLERLAKALAPEDVQLFYQTAITGRRDLALAPDPRSGFEMTLLRMIAFRPLGEAEQPRGASSANVPTGGGAAAARAAATGGAGTRASASTGPSVGAGVSAGASGLASEAAGTTAPQTPAAMPGAAAARAAAAARNAPRGAASPPAASSSASGSSASAAGPSATGPFAYRGTGSSASAPNPATSEAGSPVPDSWVDLIARLELSGAARQLASNCDLVGRQAGLVRLALDARNKHMRTAAQEEKLAQALSRHFGQPVRLEFEVAGTGIETPAQADQRASQEDLESARRAFESDPGVQGLRERFGATLLPDTVRPVK